MTSRLQGQTALVTGGGSGIGLATARALLDEGMRVAISGRDETKLRRAVESLKAGERLYYQAVDVGDADQVHALVQRVVGRFGKIDMLVNNAGMNMKERTVRELTPDSWRKQIATNLDGAFYCIHAVLPAMLERRDGHIINICSVAGLRPSPLSGAAYSASKFGMHSLGMTLAEEVRDSGIRVSNIYPGEVDTPILEQRPTPLSTEHRQKILQPEDVAAAVRFVATMPPHVSIPELIVKPTAQAFI
jgi:NADP-dependent 3-hydroxy acid dehydrogenase YdfG